MSLLAFPEHCLCKFKHQLQEPRPWLDLGVRRRPQSEESFVSTASCSCSCTWPCEFVSGPSFQGPLQAPPTRLPRTPHHPRRVNYHALLFNGTDDAPSSATPGRLGAHPSEIPSFPPLFVAWRGSFCSLRDYHIHRCFEITSLPAHIWHDARRRPRFVLLSTSPLAIHHGRSGQKSRLFS